MDTNFLSEAIAARPAEKSGKFQGICRVDSGATHGWFIRIYRSGKTHSKFYSDLKFGGKTKALGLALAFRDELRLRLGPPEPRIFRFMQRNRRNSTGVVGVSRTYRKYASGRIVHFYTVSWRPAPNQAKIKSFSIAKLGEEKAFQAAVRYRRQRERELNLKRRKVLVRGMA